MGKGKNKSKASEDVENQFLRWIPAEQGVYGVDEPEKLKEKIADQARKFWQQKLEDIAAYRKMNDPMPKDCSYRNFIRHVIEDREPSIESFSRTSAFFEHLMKPTLRWTKIEECLSGIDLDEKKRELLLIVLKPYPIEDLFQDPEEKRARRITREIIKRHNKRIKKMSPLLKQLINLQKEKSFVGYAPLLDTIEKIEYEILFMREIVRQGKSVHKRYYEEIELDKSLKGSLQKHNFWNLAVSGALKILNPLYHTDKCSRRCTKTHESAIRKVAELLKILYPTIWTEQQATIIRRIKQKNYRALPI